jgi:hypothetical protein
MPIQRGIKYSKYFYYLLYFIPRWIANYNNKFTFPDCDKTVTEDSLFAGLTNIGNGILFSVSKPSSSISVSPSAYSKYS